MKTPYLGIEDLSRKLRTQQLYNRRAGNDDRERSAFGLEWDPPEDQFNIEAHLILPEGHPLWGHGRHCNAVTLWCSDSGPTVGWSLHVSYFDLEVIRGAEGEKLLHPRQFRAAVLREALQTRETLTHLIELLRA